MKWQAIDANKERTDLTDSDVKYIQELTENGEKPIITTEKGELLNLSYVVKVVTVFDELPEFKGGDPATRFMKRERGEEE